MENTPEPTKLSAIEFAKEKLNLNPEASYAEIKAQAKFEGIPIFPVVYGRAKALLGLVPTAPYGSKSKARKLAAEEKAERERLAAAQPAPEPRVTNGSRSRTERVRSGAWDPDHHNADRESRDALAARGYWQAFQIAKDDAANVITGEEPGNLVSRTHRDWYRELFQPCVAAGLTSATVLAGYRNDAVLLRSSRHVPPRSETMRDAMPTLFDLLTLEDEPSVRAVLGHWLFGYIHPYPDGNGRMARFLMNVMLASGGYPWTIIPVERRDHYMASLESASVGQNIKPFAEFVGRLVQDGLEGKPVAGIPS